MGQMFRIHYLQFTINLTKEEEGNRPSSLFRLDFKNFKNT